MAVLSRFLQFSLILLAVNASPLERRGTVGADDIVGFPETVPGGTVGTVYEAYQPYLYVVNGCVPFPAVDAAGVTKYVTEPQMYCILMSNFFQRRLGNHRRLRW